MSWKLARRLIISNELRMLVICRDNSLFALKCLLPGALQPNCFSIETQIIYKWTVWKLSNSHGSWTIYASRPTYLVRLRLGTWMKITRQSIMFDAEFLESHNINFAVSFLCVCDFRYFYCPICIHVLCWLCHVSFPPASKANWTYMSFKGIASIWKTATQHMSYRIILPSKKKKLSYEKKKKWKSLCSA